jgi:hypothetical protein
MKLHRGSVAESILAQRMADGFGFLMNRSSKTCLPAAGFEAYTGKGHESPTSRPGNVLLAASSLQCGEAPTQPRESEPTPGQSGPPPTSTSVPATRTVTSIPATLTPTAPELSPTSTPLSPTPAPAPPRATRTRPPATPTPGPPTPTRPFVPPTATPVPLNLSGAWEGTLRSVPSLQGPTCPGPTREEVQVTLTQLDSSIFGRLETPCWGSLWLKGVVRSGPRSALVSLEIWSPLYDERFATLQGKATSSTIDVSTNSQNAPLRALVLSR